MKAQTTIKICSSTMQLYLLFCTVNVQLSQNLNLKCWQVSIQSTYFLWDKSFTLIYKKSDLKGVCQPKNDNIGMTHVFSCIKICRVPRKLFKHLQRDLASVNAMKQTCVIVNLAYFTGFEPKT